jgi:hypothetical protein
MVRYSFLNNVSRILNSKKYFYCTTEYKLFYFDLGKELLIPQLLFFFLKNCLFSKTQLITSLCLIYSFKLEKAYLGYAS